MNTHRIQEPQPTPPSRSRVRCQKCQRGTTGGKPFCDAHVDEMPYVRSLSERIAAYEAAGGGRRRRSA